MTSPSTVSAAQLLAWQSTSEAAPLVIDVRSAAEFDAVHVRGAYHVPLPTLGEHTRELADHLAHDDRVVLVCQSGVRAEQGRRHLAAVGLEHAQVLDGGVAAYEQAGGDVVRGRRAWALERQVRLTAGSLVVTGLAAGRFVSPRARLLAAAIGTGLTVSALTDTCAMGAALARMPWNRDHTDPEPTDTLDRLARRTRAA
ncbi:rhodanese-like domain-containing protein [Actinomycetospora corticicola]|uniref:Rhodanese-related sulfurtransferase n=1 Tax=Actinomycetospora corticicola TaxID=663602 RepID=A0A7Y9DTB4_9PSEU|nr:rhodanese-related sulfurtransferase [Actinomycetospora corticicola]